MDNFITFMVNYIQLLNNTFYINYVYVHTSMQVKTINDTIIV